MPAWLRRVSPVILCAALLAAQAAPARAQTNETADKAAAKEHYDRGRSFYDVGRYDDAIKEFEAAYELKNDAAILFNLAQAHRLAGSNDRALALYRTYLRNWPKGPNRAEAEKQIKALEAKLATTPGGTTPPGNPTLPTTPTTPTTPPPVGPTTPTTPTNPPPAGSEPAVVVPPGTGAPPPSNLPPAYAPPPGYVPPPASATTTTDPGRKFRIAAIASAGVGAALWIGGIIEWRRAVSASNDINDAATNMRAFDPDVQKRGQSAETAQWWFYGLGTVAIAGGAALFFYGQHVTAAESSTTWRVALAPVVTPNQSGATLRVMF